MKTTVIPASTKTGQAAVESLLARKPTDLSVIGIYRDLGKVPDKFKSDPRFEARRGDVATETSLDFAASDVVIAITPPLLFSPGDIISGARSLANNIRQAIRRSSTVRRVVYVSSMGAQFEKGTGEIATNHVAERSFTGAAPEVVFVRCAYFMENWESALTGLEDERPFIYSTITPADHLVPMVSVRDIGAFCASQALSIDITPSDEPHVTELHGPRDYSSSNVCEALQQLTGKTIELRLVGKDELATFFGNVFPPHIVPLFVEMTCSMLPGSPYLNDPGNNTPVYRGTDTLTDAFRRMLQ